MAAPKEALGLGGVCPVRGSSASPSPPPPLPLPSVPAPLTLPCGCVLREGTLGPLCSCRYPVWARPGDPACPSSGHPQLVGGPPPVGPAGRGVGVRWGGEPSQRQVQGLCS